METIAVNYVAFCSAELSKCRRHLHEEARVLRFAASLEFASVL